MKEREYAARLLAKIRAFDVDTFQTPKWRVGLAIDLAPALPFG